MRFVALQQTQYANGWDAYFYLIQLKSWIEQGKMHSPEASLIYPYMRAIQLFSGDYILTYKIVAASLAAFFTVLILGLVKNWSSEFEVNKKNNLLLLIGIWTVFLPHLTYFAAQYPKNLLGIDLFLAFVFFFPMNWVWAFVFFVLNYFGHRLTFGLCGVYVLLFFLKILFIEKIGFLNLKNLFSQQNLISRKIGFVGVSLLLGMIFLAQFFPGTFHFEDIERITTGFSNKLSFQFSPFSFWKEFDNQDRLSIWWKIEIVLAVITFLGSLFLTYFYQKERTKNHQITFSLLGILLLLPFLPWSLTSISYRFFLVFVLLSPIYLFFCLKELPIAFFQNKRIYPIVSLLFIVSFLSWESYSPKKHDPDYAFYATLTRAVQSNIPKETKPELFIVHNALAEYLTFTMGVDALPWQPEYDIAPEKLWRIAGNVTMPELAYFAKKDSIFAEIYRLPGRYALLKEQDWQRIKNNAQKDTILDSEEKMDFLIRAESWSNPYKIRPKFLLRKKYSIF
jgi:hypothetical protein